MGIQGQVDTVMTSAFVVFANISLQTLHKLIVKKVHNITELRVKRVRLIRYFYRLIHCEKSLFFIPSDIFNLLTK